MWKSIEIFITSIIIYIQLYLPSDNDISNAFHRSLYVFICDKTTCVENGGIKVLRCQLDRKNDFYPYNFNDNIVSKSKPSDWGKNLCSLCGLPAPYHCSKCKNTYYCGKYHQAYHWTNGHKDECGKEPSGKFPCNVTFKEFEIDVEDEPYNHDMVIEENKKYEKLIKKEPTEEDKISKKDIDEALKTVGSKTVSLNPYMIEFQNRVRYAPDQVVRICHGVNNSILWYTDKDRLPNDKIPNCPYCNSPRYI